MCSDEIILPNQAILIILSLNFYNYELLFLHTCIGQSKTCQSAQLEVTDTLTDFAEYV